MQGNGNNLAIDLKDVAKIYRGRRGVHALRGIEMNVHRGEVFGLLGPNGAGKSTLVKILMTVIRPTRCAGTLLGNRVGHKPTLARVGYLPEHLRFPDYLTAQQALHYFAALSKVPRAKRISRADELLETVGMLDWRSKKIKTFSKGMVQRIGLAAALMADPELVLLDEPTDGVDPVGRRDIRNVLMQMKEQGRTIFINSHLLGELEMVCDRVAILSQGLVVEQGTIDELTRESRRFVIKLASTVPENEKVKNAVADLEANIEAGERGDKLVINRVKADDIQGLIDALRGSGAVIESIQLVQWSLEDLFMRTIVDPTTGQANAPGGVQTRGWLGHQQAPANPHQAHGHPAQQAPPAYPPLPQSPPQQHPQQHPQQQAQQEAPPTHPDQQGGPN